MGEYTPVILAGLLSGGGARLAFLRTDYRFYPAYPHSYIIHLTLGLIAAALGTFAIPALTTESWEAITFLALAAQQFREVRRMEYDSLSQIEGEQIVPRGKAYIDGIAKVFEARNYLAMLVALVAASAAYFLPLPWGAWSQFLGGLTAGFLMVLVLGRLMRGKQVKDLYKIRFGKIRFDGPSLFIDEVFIANYGLAQSREEILENSVGVILEPKDDNARSTLESLGQRQAIIHDLSLLLGVRKDVGEAEWTPLLRRNGFTGQAGLLIAPFEYDPEIVLQVIGQTPVLESSVRFPLKSKLGRKASD